MLYAAHYSTLFIRKESQWKTREKGSGRKHKLHFNSCKFYQRQPKNEKIIGILYYNDILHGAH